MGGKTKDVNTPDSTLIQAEIRNAIQLLTKTAFPEVIFSEEANKSNISATPPKRANKIASQTEVEKSEINTQTELRAERRKANKQKANRTHNRGTRSVRVLL